MAIFDSSEKAGKAGCPARFSSQVRRGVLAVVVIVMRWMRADQWKSSPDAVPTGPAIMAPSPAASNNSEMVFLHSGK
jgi:hypothetical protein